MIIIFPSDTFNSREVDSNYTDKHDAAKAAGFRVALVDESYNPIKNEFRRSVLHIEPGEEWKDAIYRGWMLNKKDYSRIDRELCDKKIKLINSYTQYHHYHYGHNFILEKDFLDKKERLNDVVNSLYIPRQFAILANEGLDFLKNHKDIFPCIVKDSVKSRADKWIEACFIPTYEDLGRVVSEFKRLRGSDLEEYLIFKEYLPLTGKERRFFILKNTIMNPSKDEELNKKIKDFVNVFKIDSNFYTIDVGFTSDEYSDAVLLEIGDGQVSALDERANISPADFYKFLLANQED